MTFRKPSHPLEADDKALGDFKRLRRRVVQLKTQAEPKDMPCALALLEDAESVRNALVVCACELRDRMHFLRKGLAARAAYRQATNLVPGRLSGERK